LDRKLKEGQREPIDIYSVSGASGNADDLVGHLAPPLVVLLEGPAVSLTAVM
jgi:hypothetical protein